MLAGGLNREELARALAERGHGEELVVRVLRVLDDCDRARFATTPGTSNGVPNARAREAMLTRADQAIGDLDRGRA